MIVGNGFSAIKSENIFHCCLYSSVKLHTLMHALSPAILRVGGTTANWLFFNKPTQVLKSLHLKPGANVMTGKDYISARQ